MKNLVVGSGNERSISWNTEDRPDGRYDLVFTFKDEGRVLLTAKRRINLAGARYKDLARHKDALTVKLADLVASYRDKKDHPGSAKLRSSRQFLISLSMMRRRRCEWRSGHPGGGGF